MPLKWQEGKPLQPGWYWLHKPFMEGPYIDRVDYYETIADGLTVTSEMLVTVDDGVATPIYDQSISRYAGPIPEPVP
jgi:hypothetical protein